MSFATDDTSERGISEDRERSMAGAYKKSSGFHFIVNVCKQHW